MALHLFKQSIEIVFDYNFVGMSIMLLVKDKQ